jgi:hypothetical protein
MSLQLVVVQPEDQFARLECSYVFWALMAAKKRVEHARASWLETSRLGAIQQL